MPSHSTLVLGGGVGGLVTARELRKRAEKDHRIVLIDRQPNHLFSPSLLWLMTGDRKPEKIVRPLDCLKKMGIEVVQGTVTAIDPSGKSVQVDGVEYEADYIVVALGAQLAPEAVPGLAQSGHNLYELDGATAIRDTRGNITDGDVAVLVSSMPFKCPAAPYEAAMLLSHDFEKRGLGSRMKVSLFSPEPGPMGVTGPDNSAAVRGMVEGKGINYFPQHVLQSVDSENKTILFENGSEARFDYLVYIPPHVAPTVVVDAGLTNESGWVPVDRHTLETSFPGVFAIGDVTTIPLEVGLPLPKAGTFAHGQGKTVARIIAARASGKPADAEFDGDGTCFIEIGGGKAGIGSGNFYLSPKPVVKIRKPGRILHLIKVLFERWWFRHWL